MFAVTQFRRCNRAKLNSFFDKICKQLTDFRKLRKLTTFVVSSCVVSYLSIFKIKKIKIILGQKLHFRMPPIDQVIKQN